MSLKIFLDDRSFHCLKRSVPHGSHSKSILNDAVHLKLFGNDVVISCDEAQAHNLLLYAGHCPDVIASIHYTLRTSFCRLAAGALITTAGACSHHPTAN